MAHNRPMQAQPIEALADLRPAVLDDVIVSYRDGKRVVMCFCGEEVFRSIVPHLKELHTDQWASWVRRFVELRGRGYPLKKVMRLFQDGNGALLFSWTVVDRAIRLAVEAGTLKYKPPPKLRVKSWEPENFQVAEHTVWDFPNRGDWAVHSGDYRGNWPPQLVRNLIIRFTQPNDFLLDAFMGGGTTLIESWLLGRRSMGIDVSKLAIQTTKAKLAEMASLAKDDDRVELQPRLKPEIFQGNAIRLEAVTRKHSVEPGTVQLLCVHPPYLDSLQYTGKHSKDLSMIHDPAVFYERMSDFARQAKVMLDSNGVCALLIGDVRKDGRMIPLAIETFGCFQQQNFRLENIVIKTQHHDRSSEFYLAPRSDGLRFAHEYLFIMRRGN